MSNPRNIKIGDEEFRNFILRGVKAPLAMAKLKEWGQTCMKIEQQKQIDSSDDISQVSKFGVMTRAVERMEDGEDKTNAKEMIKQLTQIQTGSAPDFTKGGTITDTKLIAKNKKEYEDSLNDLYSKVTEFAMIQVFQHEDLTKEFTNSSIKIDEENLKDSLEIENLKIDALILALQSLDKPIELLEKFSAKNMMDLIYYIGIEEENLIKDFFTFIPEPKTPNEQVA